MSQNIYLMGSEDVAQAARTMRSAADQMERAMSTMNYEVNRLEQILREFADRMETIMKPEGE